MFVAISPTLELPLVVERNGKLLTNNADCLNIYSASNNTLGGPIEASIGLVLFLIMVNAIWSIPYGAAISQAENSASLPYQVLLFKLESYDLS